MHRCADRRSLRQSRRCLALRQARFVRSDEPLGISSKVTSLAASTAAVACSSRCSRGSTPSASSRRFTEHRPGSSHSLPRFEGQNETNSARRCRTGQGKNCARAHCLGRRTFGSRASDAPRRITQLGLSVQARHEATPHNAWRSIRLRVGQGPPDHDWHTGNFFAEVADCLNAFLIGHENVSD